MNLIVDKSENFALKIIEIYKYLSNEKNEYVLSKQLLRSGTSIGANIAEAQFAQSKADFTSKMAIALKEANETKYWLTLLTKSGYLSDTSISNDCLELIKILVSIVKKKET